MVTAEEDDTAAEVVAALSGHPVYRGAVDCFQERFAREGSWGSEVAKDKWGPADFEQMRLILSDWFN